MPRPDGCIPASPRVVETLARRGAQMGHSDGEWIFPALTAEGHINTDSLKKQHIAALEASGVETFRAYSLRHTCLTRWAESGMDVFTLKKLAGHANISTTERYVHMNDAKARSAMEKAWEVSGGHKSGHNAKSKAKRPAALKAVAPIRSVA
jgi:integrase